MTTQTDAQPAPKRSNTFRHVRIAIQSIVAIGLLALLGWLAWKYKVVDTLRKIDVRWLILAWMVWILSTAINSVRWKLLLDNVGIERSFFSLWPLYLIGLFFSQFLPSGTGGDAVRIFEVSRRSGRIAGAIVAVLQERVFGLGISMLIGLGMSVLYWKQLPTNLRLWVVLIQLAGPIGLLVFCYPHRFVAIAQRFTGGLGRKAGKILQPVLDLPPLTVTRLLSVVGVTSLGVVTSISVYAILAHAVGVRLGLTAFLLAVPLVWVIKMAPVSLGGLGVGELALVAVLFTCFNVEKQSGGAISAVYLGLQIITALLGGVILAIKMATGTWIPPKKIATVNEADDDAEPVPATPNAAPAEVRS